MSKGKLIFIVIGAVVLLGLFMWPKLNDPNKGLKKAWAQAGIECLDGHSNVASHIHPNLEIMVDGARQTIPSNIGVVRGCMAEIHTHDSSGKLHVESAIVGKTFTLSHFFEVWGEDLEKDGYVLEATADGIIHENIGQLILQDGQEIILNYNK